MTASGRITLADVDCTRNCPLAAKCESCGCGGSLGIAAMATPLGVLCMTICEECVIANNVPVLDYDGAVRLVLRHCEHLGITADEMEAALAGGGR